MHKNIFWQAFLAVVFGATLWYTILALYSYYSYSHLIFQIRLSNINWTIEEKSEEDYFIKASYQYNFQETHYSGTTLFKEENYRNSWSAEQALKESVAKQWKLWIDPQTPEHSSLQKNFPFKECVSAVFLWVLLLYFLWLGFYVAKFKN